MGKHKQLSLDTHNYKTTFTSTTKIVLRFSISLTNGIVSIAFGFVCTVAATMVDVAKGAAVADDDAISTVVPPYSTKREGVYVGVSVAF